MTTKKQTEHEHSDICKAVMEIRNTTIDGGIPILEALLAQAKADGAREFDELQIKMFAPINVAKYFSITVGQLCEEPRHWYNAYIRARLAQLNPEANKNNFKGEV